MIVSCSASIDVDKYMEGSHFSVLWTIAIYHLKDLTSKLKWLLELLSQRLPLEQSEGFHRWSLRLAPHGESRPVDTHCAIQRYGTDS